MFKHHYLTQVSLYRALKNADLGFAQSLIAAIYQDWPSEEQIEEFSAECPTLHLASQRELLDKAKEAFEAAGWQWIESEKHGVQMISPEGLSRSAKAELTIHP